MQAGGSDDQGSECSTSAIRHLIPRRFAVMSARLPDMTNGMDASRRGEVSLHRGWPVAVTMAAPCRPAIREDASSNAAAVGEGSEEVDGRNSSLHSRQHGGANSLHRRRDRSCARDPNSAPWTGRDRSSALRPEQRSQDQPCAATLRDAAHGASSNADLER